jgi:hypothetical protein
LDGHGTVIDELPASTRRGLNRVVWTMHLRAPHVPPAVQVSQAGLQGPRVLPGTYTVRMEKNGQRYETKLNVVLDPRVTWSEDDRRTQYEAAMKVYELFNDESEVFARIAALRRQVAGASQRPHLGDSLRARLQAFDAKLDSVRKQIVATTEGGAITGEERLREHTDQLYGAINAWEGPPSQYQLDNIEALRAQLNDIDAEFSRIAKAALPSLNNALEHGGIKPLEVPAATHMGAEPGGGGSAGASANRSDADMRIGTELPQRLRLWN